LACFGHDKSGCLETLSPTTKTVGHQRTNPQGIALTPGTAFSMVSGPCRQVATTSAQAEKYNPD